MRRIQFGIGAAIVNLVIGFFLDYWMYTISIQYDLTKGWAVIASLIDVTLCILIYPLFFVILRYAVLRRPLSVKKAHLISVPWHIVAWMVVIAMNSANGQHNMTYFPLNWMEINAAILYCGKSNAQETVPHKQSETKEEPDPNYYENRMRELFARYRKLKADVQAVKPDDIHAYYHDGKMTEQEYNDILAAYREAIDEMQRIRAEAKSLKEKYEGEQQ